MKRKWTWFMFWPGDFKAVERYLNRQAAKGWELEKPGTFARWKRTERNDLRWCVDLAGPKDKKNPGKQESYRQICAEGGWELAGLFNQMYFFRSMPGRNVVPLQTDPELELELYRTNHLKCTGRNLIFNVLTAVLIFFNVSVRKWPTEWLNRLLQGLAAAILLMTVWRVADLLRAWIGVRKTGGISSPTWIMWVNWIVQLLAGVMLILCAVAIIGFVIGV